VLNWPFDACRIYGRLRAELQKKGTPVGAMDLLIAAHAVLLDAVLVTSNKKEFQRIPNLKIEDWLL